MAIINIKNFIRKEVQKLFEDGEGQVSVGLPTPNVVNRNDGDQHRTSDGKMYSVEYFDTKMGTKQLAGGYRMASIAKQNGLEFYKDEKANNHLGTVTDYIGVNSDIGNEFFIFYVNKSYISGVHRNIFDSDQAYQNWMKVAYQVMKTGKPAGGQFKVRQDRSQASQDRSRNELPFQDSLKEIEMDFPSGLANTSGATSPQDVIRAKSDFTDRNFPPNIQIKKKGEFYIFYGETFNVRDIFDLMKHHVLIPFQLKVVNDTEYWITKSKESAQKAIEMIQKRYPQSKQTDRIKIKR